MEEQFEMSERARATLGQAIYTICHRAGIDCNGLACPYCLHQDICVGSSLKRRKRPTDAVADPFDVAA